MREVWVSNWDGSAAARADEIVAVRATTDGLEAQTRASGAVLLVRGAVADEQAAVRGLLETLATLVRGAFVVAAQVDGDGVTWHASPLVPEGGSAGGSKAGPLIDKQALVSGTDRR